MHKICNDRLLSMHTLLRSQSPPYIYRAADFMHVWLHRQVDKPELPAQSAKRRACVFSVQCGTHTHFMAASTAAEAQVRVFPLSVLSSSCHSFSSASSSSFLFADSHHNLSVQLWVDRITQTWVHCSKFTGRSIRARNLQDSFVTASSTCCKRMLPCASPCPN